MAFLTDMGPCPSDCSLDRINNDGNYEPGNCRWTLIDTQANNRHSNVRLAFNGQTMTVAEWARAIGMLDGTLENRLKSGWSTERALTTPVGRKQNYPPATGQFG